MVKGATNVNSKLIAYNGFGLGAVVCRLCAVGKLRIGAVMCL